LQEIAVERRPSSSLVATGVACALALAFVGRPASAAPKDAAAMKLYRDAIESDYLGMQFGAAEKKLKQAIALCGASGCAPGVVAQLHRDLGVVYLAGNKRPDDARTEFATALKIDPALTLLKDLATPEAAQLFAEVKGAAAPEATPGSAGGKEELTHVPPKEAGVSTPLPLYVELADGVTVVKVQVRYKSPATGEWKTLDLNKLASGYGIELPCAEVGPTSGELRYFIQTIGASGESAATHGTRNAPHVVPIVTELTSAPAHLPGKPPPESCAGALCPPGSPGCDAAGAATGATCSDDAQCASAACREGVCAAAEAATSKACQADGDCGDGGVCSAGVCGVAAKKNWLSLSIQQEALFLPTVNGACSTDATYACYDGTEPYDLPSHNLTPGTDNVEGGFSLATARVLVGYERVVHPHITVGAKLGFAFNHGPTQGSSSFLPLHAEARVAYWFGSHPTARTGLRPFVVLSGGVAEVDAKRRFVAQDVRPPYDSNYNLQAWRKAGQGFAALGGGIMYALSPSSGITVELKVLQMLGTSATGVAGQLGYALGL